MPQVRQGNQILEISPEEVGKRLRAEVATPLATTPAGAAAIGATPDQSKMMQTPAQQQKSLTQVQRLTMGPTAEQQATAKAKTATQKAVGALGGLEGRVAAKAAQLVTSATQAQVAPTIDEEAFKGFMAGKSTEEVNAARAALEVYRASARTPDDVAALANVIGLDNLDAGTLNSLFQSASTALGAAASTAKPAAKLTIKDILESGAALTPDESAALTEAASTLGLGFADLQSLTPEELQAKLKDFQAAQFSTMDTLKAEYVNAGPARRAQILADLKAADSTGVDAAEFAVAQLEQEIASDQIVKFANQDYKLADLLSNDALSDVVKEAASNPAVLAELKRTEPALAGWIETNQAALAAVAEQSAQSVLSVQRTQEDAAAITAGLPDALAKAILSPQPAVLTAAQVEANKQAIANNPLAQLALDPKLPWVSPLLTSNPDLIQKLQSPELTGVLNMLNNQNFVNTLTQNPGLVDKLKGLDAPTITELQAVNDKIATSTFVDFLKLGGYNPDAGWITDPANAKQVAEWQSWAEQMEAVEPGAANSPDFKWLADKGLLDRAAMEHLAKHPGLRDDLRELQEQKEFMATKPNVDQITTRMFGSSIDVDDVFQQFSDAQKTAQYGATEAERSAATEFVNNLAALFNAPGEKNFTLDKWKSYYHDSKGRAQLDKYFNERIQAIVSDNPLDRFKTFTGDAVSSPFERARELMGSTDLRDNRWKGMYVEPEKADTRTDYQKMSKQDQEIHRLTEYTRKQGKAQITVDELRGVRKEQERHLANLKAIPKYKRTKAQQEKLDSLTAAVKDNKAEVQWYLDHYPGLDGRITVDDGDVDNLSETGDWIPAEKADKQAKSAGGVAKKKVTTGVNKIIKNLKK